MSNTEIITRKKVGGQPKYDRQAVSEYICEQLKLGRSVESISKEPGMPTWGAFLEWVRSDPKIAEDYARAREIGYSLLADEIIALSDKTHEWVMVQELDSDGRAVLDEQGQPRLRKVLAPLSADMIAHKRVQIDTRKWMLSKMLPKVYGDKVTQEHTGAGGGPIAIASVDLKNLSDTELESMQKLMTKASGSET